MAPLNTDAFEYQIARVRAMAHDADGESWDLGGTDRAALLGVLASHRELLDAAKLACDVIGNTRDELGLKLEAEKAYLALRAAIAKAEGR